MIIEDRMARKKILIHPGDILRGELKARGLSANQFGLDLAVPSGRIVEILNGKRGVTLIRPCGCRAILGRPRRSG